MQIYDMKVNHLTNPLGFRMPRTVFSWKVKEAEGRRQAAARLQVAADEGIMPQTKEHVDILSLLCLTRVLMRLRTVWLIRQR